MTKKVCYFDTETTGTDPATCGLIQLAMIIEVGGKEVDQAAWHLQPFPDDKISQEALDVNGITMKQLKEFAEPKVIHKQVVKFLGKHVNKFSRADKFYPAGYNVNFDLDMLAAWFRKCGDKYVGSWFNWKRIDPLPLIYWMDLLGDIDLPNYKLATVCDHFKIDLKDAHDAMADIEATRELIKGVIADMMLPVPR